MNAYDIKADIEFKKQNDKMTFLNAFGGAVAKEVEKVQIKYELTTKEHTFGDGEKGEIAKKLVIEIDFNDAVVQPHQDFEGEFCGAVVDVIQENINGLFENYDN